MFKDNGNKNGSEKSVREKRTPYITSKIMYLTPIIFAE